MTVDQTVESNLKRRNLLLGVLFDIVGLVSYGLPLLGEVTVDVIWAPVSGLILSKMYKGTKGKIGGIFSVVEELFPFTDAVPTFTLMWVYTYVWKRKPSKELKNGSNPP